MKQDWMEIAKAELGVKEKRGGENPRIIEYHSTTTLKAKEDEIPWCSAFVNWVMKQAGYKGTNSAAAKSWLNWGVEVTEDEDIPYGAIAVFTRQGGGHVGFITDANDDSIKILGGNQSDMVCEKWFGYDNLLSIRMPKIVENE